MSTFTHAAECLPPKPSPPSITTSYQPVSQIPSATNSFKEMPTFAASYSSLSLSSKFSTTQSLPPSLPGNCSQHCHQWSVKANSSYSVIFLSVASHKVDHFPFLIWLPGYDTGAFPPSSVVAPFHPALQILASLPDCLVLEWPKAQSFVHRYYIHSTGDLTQSHGSKRWLYADNSQIYSAK